MRRHLLFLMASAWRRRACVWSEHVEISDSAENILPPGCDYASFKLNKSKTYDLCVVGAGLSGTVFAERTANVLGETVLVIDNRPHIGGNCYDFVDQKTGVLRNQYGSHLFHTNLERVWRYVTNPKAPPWRSWYHQKLGVVNGSLVPIPPNIATVNRLFGETIKTKDEMASWLQAHQVPCPKSGCRNGEEMAMSRVGEELYRSIFETYTLKQWGKSAREMDAAVLARIPVHGDFDPRYFTDRFQALPLDGYTAWFAAMLKHPQIDVVLSVDFFDHKSHLEKACGKIVYTGPIDRYFEAAGKQKLEYRSITFTEFRYYNVSGYVLPTPVVNYPGPETPFTRAVEYKHYLHRQAKADGSASLHSIVVKETSSDHGEPYYPVPTPRNRALYDEYKQLAAELERTGKIVFVGRLANYKYFDMDKAIDNALELFYQSAWKKLFTGRHFKEYRNRIDSTMERGRAQRRRTLQKCRSTYAAWPFLNLTTPFWPGEFGMELRLLVPWAYFLSRRCRIRTRSVAGSRYMYFFSDDHGISHIPRQIRPVPWPNPFHAKSVHISDSHLPERMSWLPPPFKSFFQRPEVREMLANRPLVVVQNKYNSEWGRRPLNYMKVSVLHALLKCLTTKYTVVYKRHTSSRLVERHSAAQTQMDERGNIVRQKGAAELHMELGEKQMVRDEFPSVVLFEDLAAQIEDVSADDDNLLLFGLMASSDRFVTVQGGTAVVSSYFGGNTTILIKEGGELEHGDYTYFKRFSNASVRWMTTDEQFLQLACER